MGQTVTAVELFSLTHQLDEPFAYSQSWVNSREALVVKLETADGAVGWGECWGPVAGNTEIIADLFAPVVIGRDLTDFGAVHDDLMSLGRAAYQTFVPYTAISGIDIAMWDLRGKDTEQSIASLLGGRRRQRVEAYATGHYFPDVESLESVIEKILAEARENAAAFSRIKLKLGLSILGFDWEADLALVRRVRQELGDDIDIMVDANYAYDLVTAKRVSETLAALDVRWFEEPVPPEQFAAYRELARSSEVPIAAGECHAPYEFDRLFDDGAIHIGQPDICNVGGFTAVQYLQRLAAEHSVRLVPHVWGTPIALAASLQFLAVLPYDSLLEYDRSPNPVRDQFPGDRIRVDDGGIVHVPDGPGLGIEIDEEALRQQADAISRVE